MMKIASDTPHKYHETRDIKEYPPFESNRQNERNLTNINQRPVFSY